jgi:hypothetical protein
MAHDLTGYLRQFEPDNLTWIALYERQFGARVMSNTTH